MSIEATSWVLTQERTTTATQRVVLLGIADHADRFGLNSWPSVATLALYANVSVRSVQAALRQLEEAGIIATEINGGGSRSTPADQRPNLYAIVAMTRGVQSTAPGVEERGAVQRVSGCSPARFGVQPTAPEPPMNLPEPPTRRSAATSVPETVEAFLTPEAMEWARHNAIHVRLSDETATLIDWCKANGRRQRDWSAFWRNWMRRSNERAQTGMAAPLAGDWNAEDAQRAALDAAQQEGLI